MAKKSTAAVPTMESTSPSSSGLEVNPASRELIIKECEAQGLTLSHLVSTIKRATHAKKVTYDKFGDSHEEEDYQTQLKAATTGLEVRGELKLKDSSSGTTVNFIDVKAIIQQFKGVK